MPTVRKVVGLLIAALLAMSALLFVWPATNAPAKVDAIVVLGGAGDRIAKGIALARAQIAPVLVISESDTATCPRGFSRVRVICFQPNPDTTQGEAREAARLAARYHWSRLLVVSDTPQTTRARIRFDRCYHGRVLFAPVSPGGIVAWAHGIVYEWGALAKALVLQRGC
jgi:uncharacterized SAM-binding protein YcdF (DUF218 family)